MWCCSGFVSPELQPLNGLTLGQVATQRGTSPEDTAIDLVIEDGSRVSSIYFLMSEENIHRQIALPWLSFGSDGGSMATEGSFLNRRNSPPSLRQFRPPAGEICSGREGHPASGSRAEIDFAAGGESQDQGTRAN